MVVLRRHTSMKNRKRKCKGRKVPKIWPGFFAFSILCDCVFGSFGFNSRCVRLLCAPSALEFLNSTPTLGKSHNVPCLL